MNPVWPLTGRAEELRFFDTAIEPGLGSRSSGLVLAGAAGVGKTRLAQEVLSVAAGRGASTRWVVGTDSARVLPLGAFGELMGGADGGDPALLLRQARATLLAGMDPADVVVGVDDAHLLDPLSALLVHQIVLRAAATVVVTVRSGQQAPDAITALWKDGLLQRMELQSLSRKETTELVEAVLGGPIETATVDRIWALTQGNALFLRQLVDGEREAGRLRGVDGLWLWSGEPVISPALIELVGTRMGALTDAVREVVDVLALAEPMGVGMLVRLTDPASVEQAEERGLLTVQRDGARLVTRLAHPLYGEVRRAHLGVLRARRLRGRIASALHQAGGRRAGDTLRYAVLAVDSDLVADARLLTDAARDAVALFDLGLAERLSRAAAAAGGGFDARLILASVLSWNSRGEEAEVELSALTASAADDDQRIRAAVPRAANLFWTLCRPADAQTVVDDADALVSGGVSHRVLAAVRAAFHGGAGRPAEAIEAAQTALADPDLPGQAVVLATWGLVGGLGSGGRADGVDAAVTRAYSASARSFDAAMLRFGLTDFHLDALRLAGRVHEAARFAAERRADSADVPGPAQLFGITLLAQAELAGGRLRTAIRWLREAQAGFIGDKVGWRYRCLISLTQALAMAGDAVVAADTEALMLASRHQAFGCHDPEVLLARAWVAAAGGTVSAAVRLAREAAELAAGRGQYAHEVHALHTAVRFGDHATARRLTDLTTLVDGPRAPAAARHATALSAADPAALHAVSLEWEQLGDLLAAADAEAQAALAYTARGLTGSSQVAAARAARLAEACQGARTPALLAAQRPLPLTDREREIVTLVARGLSNREIADHLVVSVRTVEGHLYRASAKLGLTNRTDLAAILRAP